MQSLFEKRNVRMTCKTAQSDQTWKSAFGFEWKNSKGLFPKPFLSEILQFVKILFCILLCCLKTRKFPAFETVN